jgi:alkylated DNA repair dioxygenase AlkB
MYLCCKHTRPDLDVDLYPTVLNPELAGVWYQYLERIFPPEQSRTSMLFGDPGLVYRVTYQETTTEREVMPWDTLPAMPELKDLVSKMTGQKYTVCAVQCYPNGRIGIAPHRDKEMVAGTRISGLSIGAERTIQFTRLGHEPVSLRLPSGSLYVMNPPTNQKWLHSIIREARVKDKRYSFTFRDYIPQ